jgi:hypothetical protein
MDTSTRDTARDPAIVGVFDDRAAAERAVETLYSAGFAHDRVGFVIRGADDVAGGMITDAEGTKDTKGIAAGALTGGVVGGVLATALSVILPPVGPILAGGLLAAFFGGAIAGTAVGGIYGALQGLGVSEDEARFYERAFHEGRAIVAVKAGARTADAADLLTRCGGRHVHRESTSPVQTEGVFNTP